LTFHRGVDAPERDAASAEQALCQAENQAPVKRVDARLLRLSNRHVGDGTQQPKPPFGAPPVAVEKNAG
jgi:hypothetical protein